MQPQAHSSKSLSTLPLELRHRIVQHFTYDTVFLWTSLRNVSHIFRAHVDALFADKHIKKTQIDFRVDSEISIPTYFERFSQDSRHAIFKAKNDDFQERYLPMIQRKWRAAMDMYLGAGLSDEESGCRDQPVHAISVRRDVNDTELPGLEVDYDKWEISTDWRAMFSVFFREMHYVDRQMRKWSENKGGQLRQEAKRKVEVDLFDQLDESMNQYEDISDEIRRDGRRKRIRDLFKEHDNFDWNAGLLSWEHEEKPALDRLKSLRFASGFQEFSDDEEETAEKESRKGKSEIMETAEAEHDESDDDEEDEDMSEESS